MSEKNWIIEISKESGKEGTWVRWPSNQTLYTQQEASDIVNNIHETNKKLMEHDKDREDKNYNALDRYQARCSPAPKEEPPKPKDDSVLAQIRRNGKL